MNLHRVSELEAIVVILVDALSVPSWSVGASAIWFLNRFDVALTDLDPLLGIWYRSGPRPGITHLQKEP